MQMRAGIAPSINYIYSAVVSLVFHCLEEESDATNTSPAASLVNYVMQVSIIIRWDNLEHGETLSTAPATAHRYTVNRELSFQQAICYLSFK